ncbi:MAG TPA: hypothetical protein VMM18_10925, partial [Gemmatimonadaceae bacterium]|nr:hypothetical protein [Gemmatimonadaceae bacterium]
MRTKRRRCVRHALAALSVVFILLLDTCAPAGSPGANVRAPARDSIDPRIILRARLSHGFGASPFDDLLWTDSRHAAILVVAASGAPEDELLALASRPDSGRARLARLVERKLLVRDATTFRPSFPILADERATAYYALVEMAAHEVMTVFSPSLDSLLIELHRRGWSDWGYHFLWSQLIDSQFAWVEMIERGLVPPLSTVVAWVVYPEHPWKTGTNLVPEESADHFLAISWTPGGSSLARLYDDWRPIYTSALAGAPADSATATTLRALELISEDGTLQIPVVRADDPLHRFLRELSGRMVSAMADALPHAQLRALTGLESHLVFAVAYHDLGWEVLRLAAESGRVRRPPGLE